MTDEFHPLQVARIREMTLSERFARGLEFLRATREFVAAGIRSRHPEWSSEQVQAELRRVIHDVRD
jgi:hypothetical protein